MWLTQDINVFRVFFTFSGFQFNFRFVQINNSVIWKVNSIVVFILKLFQMCLIAFYITIFDFIIFLTLKLYSIKYVHFTVEKLTVKYSRFFDYDRMYVSLNFSFPSISSLQSVFRLPPWIWLHIFKFYDQKSVNIVGFSTVRASWKIECQTGNDF